MGRAAFTPTTYGRSRRPGAKSPPRSARSDCGDDCGVPQCGDCGAGGFGGGVWLVSCSGGREGPVEIQSLELQSRGTGEIFPKPRPEFLERIGGSWREERRRIDM